MHLALAWLILAYPYSEQSYLDALARGDLVTFLAAELPTESGKGQTPFATCQMVPRCSWQDYPGKPARPDEGATSLTREWKAFSKDPTPPWAEPGLR